jgi:hypothetical protein
VGQRALDACGEYGELANWPVSSKTDYYNLAGKDFTGTCRRTAELADEKAKKGVGRKFLEEMEESTSRKSPLPTPPAPDEAEEQEDGRKRGGEEYRESNEEQAEKSEKAQDYPEEKVPTEREGEGRQSGRSHEPDGSEPIESFEGEDLRDVDLEEFGREVLRFIRSYTGQRSKPARRESDAQNEEEGD